MSMASRWRRGAMVVVMLSGTTFGGCLPSGFGSDLAASTISAVYGDVLYTILDYVLPRPPE